LGIDNDFNYASLSTSSYNKKNKKYSKVSSRFRKINNHEEGIYCFYSLKKSSFNCFFLFIKDDDDELPEVQYQIITICNTLPSILKCQNQHHFLILFRIFYGLSHPNNDQFYNSRPQLNPNQCSPQSNCFEIEHRDEFNCTGSNICIFYPTYDRALESCYQIKSNLTQIHITCVDLSFLKKYYRHRNNRRPQQQQFPSTTLISMNEFKTTTRRLLTQTSNNDSNNIIKTTHLPKIKFKPSNSILFHFFVVFQHN
jgi:hypothetical protein